MQEVLQIAGGLPDRAALDEISYRQAEPALVQGPPIASGGLHSPSNEP